MNVFSELNMECGSLRLVQECQYECIAKHFYFCSSHIENASVIQTTRNFGINY